MFSVGENGSERHKGADIFWLAEEYRKDERGCGRLSVRFVQVGLRRPEAVQLRLPSIPTSFFGRRSIWPWLIPKLLVSSEFGLPPSQFVSEIS